jgi:hypothetical protein
MKHLASFLVTSILIVSVNQASMAQSTVAQQWNEALLDAIRIDFPAPTIHSRNLYHTSVAMYDAWTTFDGTANGVFYQDKHTASDIEEARNEAISYAAYGVLSERYTHAVDPIASQALFDNLMNTLGYDANIVSTVGDTPAAIGNRIATEILSSNMNDGSNEANHYVDDTDYTPSNMPMLVDYPTVTDQLGTPLANPNRWQPLYLESYFTQNGQIGLNLQDYVGHIGEMLKRSR